MLINPWNPPLLAWAMAVIRKDSESSWDSFHISMYVTPRVKYIPADTL